MAGKKQLELDVRVQGIIEEEFSDFEKYLPTPQDAHMYRRKRADYWNRILARIKEANGDGRADSAGNE